VGWSVRNRLDEHLTLEALRRAVESRRPSAGLIHHTDRGAPYCGAQYQKALSSAGLEPSMSRTGDCLDNAMAESWVKTLKAELGREFAGQSLAQQKLFEYIEGFYNTRRLHSALGYLSPAEVERQAARTAPGHLRGAVATAADATTATAIKLPAEKEKSLG
ncbi:MAG: DDE-type integrase/transposase/recombinase, partial [Acidobacteriota bacterium]